MAIVNNATIKREVHIVFQISVSESVCTPIFIAAQFIVAKMSRCPSVNEWIKKPWYIYIMKNNVEVLKKNFLLFEIVWRYLDSIMLSKISQ